MIERNRRFTAVAKPYLFQEIGRRVAQFQLENPEAKLYNLGIGDTTIPLSTTITEPLARYVLSLSTEEGYTGYQNEQGNKTVRALLSEKMYNSEISPEEIFLSDGAKCDIGRLQSFLSHLSPVLIQDPTYPVYRDGTSLLSDQEIIYAECLPENDFFPTISGEPKLIYLCSPNNPTGTALTFLQLEKIVDYARAHSALIVYDAAYRFFIEGNDHPRSIYEIAGADEVAIEVNSFSKFAGFTGIRLGWTVIPKKLGAFYSDYARLHATIFNGASLLSQKAGEIALQDGYEASMHTVYEYKKNTTALKNMMEAMGYTVYGGIHSPYLWVHTPEMRSWDTFEYLLKTAHIVTTPGCGFGPSGEGFVRLSAFFPPRDREIICALLSSSTFQQSRFDLSHQ